MKSSTVIRERLLRVDREEQRTARRVLRNMIRTGELPSWALTVVATVTPLRRKQLGHLTVADLVTMGIVAVGDNPTRLVEVGA